MRKLKMAPLYIYLTLVFSLWSSVFFSGCVHIREGFRGLLGTSIKVLEEGRKDAVKSVFPYDYFTCYTKTLDILKKHKSYVYAEEIKKYMIAIYISSQDTTPVGLFFTEIDKNNTQIEVSSASKFARELISQRIYSELQK
ncbi:MAG: hypothetical protein KKC42_03435 [Candidatus Omnitrophica bacterium]|nr:hypothetical protein [Candidatus Omnitrophota bacterium]